jgi:hypothetical protein
MWTYAAGALLGLGGVTRGIVLLAQGHSAKSAIGYLALGGGLFVFDGGVALGKYKAELAPSEPLAQKMESDSQPLSALGVIIAIATGVAAFLAAFTASLGIVVAVSLGVAIACVVAYVVWPRLFRVHR